VSGGVLTVAVPSLSPARRALRAWVIANRTDILWLVAVTLVAALPRLILLGHTPPGLHGDEAVAGIEARSLLDHGHLSQGVAAPYSLEALGVPAGTFYWTAAVLGVLGQSIFTLRLAYALLGIAGVALTYLACRIMFSRSVAVIAALLLSVSAWHLYYSRVAFIPIGWPLMEMATLALLFLAVRRDSRWLYGAAGAALAGGVYTYQAYLMFALGLAIVVAIIGALEYRTRLRRYANCIATFFAVALFVGLPMASFAYHHPESYTSRYRAYSVTRTVEYKHAGSVFDKAHVLATRELKYVRQVIGHPAPDGVDGAGIFPLIDRVTLGLLIAGGGIALWRARKAPYAAVVVLIAVIGVGPALAQDGWYRRTLGAVPLLMTVAALPLALVWDEGRKRGPWTTAAAGLVVVGVLGGVAGINLGRYFGSYNDSEPARHVLAADFAAASQYMNSLPKGTHVLLFDNTHPFNYETRQYVAPDVTGEDRATEFKGSGTLDADSLRYEDLAFVFVGKYVGMLSEVEQRYPGGTPREQQRSNDKIVYQAYYLPKIPGVTPPPTPHETPTVQATPAAGDDERDRRREQDILALQSALAQYRDKHGTFPSNGGGIQTLCVYRNDDVGCKLMEFLDPLPQDPAGDSNTNGYFYQSDGSTYAIYALRQSTAVPECAERPPHLKSLPSVLCARGP